MKDKYVEELSNLIEQIDDREYLNSFLKDLLTEKELKDITERIQIFRLLKQGKTQRYIAEKLNISVTTVNRWAKVLKNWEWAFSHLKIVL